MREASEAAPTGREPLRPEPLGPEPTGREPLGDGPLGRELAGRDPMAREPVGCDPLGRDRTGRDASPGGRAGRSPVARGVTSGRGLRAAVRALAVGAILALVGASVGAAQAPSAPVPNPPTWAGAEAVAASVGAPPVPVSGGPYAALPPAGGNVTQAAGTLALGGVGTLDLPSVSASGGPIEGRGGTASTTAAIWRVDLFGGRVRARDVRVSARAGMDLGQATADGDVYFEGLTVDGRYYPDPALNQEIPLPGLGRLVVRERTVLQFGPAAATAFVRAFRVVLTEGGVAGAPVGGEVLIGAVAAGVPDVALLPPGAPAADARPTIGEYVPISTRAPVDTTIRTTIIGNENAPDDNDNDNDDDNGNGNTNDNGGDDGAAPTGTPRSTGTPGGTTPVVVTVVVVVQTPTPSPSP
jgi:hypothetical protein